MMSYASGRITRTLDGQKHLSFRHKRNTLKLAHHLKNKKVLVFEDIAKLERKDHLDSERYWTSLCWLLMNGFAYTHPGEEGIVQYSLVKGVTV